MAEPLGRLRERQARVRNFPSGSAATLSIMPDEASDAAGPRRRPADLAGDYEQAWEEWASSGEVELWDSTAGDGSTS
jgi:hypothetical protein